MAHPGPSSLKNAPSVAAIVGSFDKYFAQYAGDIKLLASRQEIMAAFEMAPMVLGRLKLFKQRNSDRLPTKIVVYRDGVSDGQYQQLLDQEYNGMRMAFKRAYGEDEKAWPEVTILVSTTSSPSSVQAKRCTGGSETTRDSFLSAKQ